MRQSGESEKKTGCDDKNVCYGAISLDYAYTSNTITLSEDNVRDIKKHLSFINTTLDSTTPDMNIIVENTNQINTICHEFIDTLVLPMEHLAILLPDFFKLESFLQQKDPDSTENTQFQSHLNISKEDSTNIHQQYRKHLGTLFNHKVKLKTKWDNNGISPEGKNNLKQLHCQLNKLRNKSMMEGQTRYTYLFAGHNVQLQDLTAEDIMDADANRFWRCL